MIPKILSQTWNTLDLPSRVRPFVAGWRALNPDYEHRLYDAEGRRQVIAETFPGFLDDYDRLPYPVMHADVFRYAVVYRDGGLYADLDMECLKPVAPVFASGACVLSVEARMGATRQAELGYASDRQIANCIFGAVPGHPFFRRAVERSIELFRAHDPAVPVPVEDITGPRMLTRLVSDEPRDDLTILPQIVLMGPLEYPNIWPVNRHMYTRHRIHGTWKPAQGPLSLRRRLIERNRLPNPLPPGLAFPRREQA
jgi:mannosyltransferase OCH1-like enzyme